MTIDFKMLSQLRRPAAVSTRRMCKEGIFVVAGKPNIRLTDQEQSHSSSDPFRRTGFHLHSSRTRLQLQLRDHGVMNPRYIPLQCWIHKSIRESDGPIQSYFFFVCRGNLNWPWKEQVDRLAKINPTLACLAWEKRIPIH